MAHARIKGWAAVGPCETTWRPRPAGPGPWRTDPWPGFAASLAIQVLGFSAVALAPQSSP